MTPSPKASPTQRQLSYLRVLAAKTATTFAYPTTRAEASRQIERLRTLHAEPVTRGPHDEDSDSAHLVYATAVHDSEVSGFGSSASWRAGSRPASHPPLPMIRAGQPTELARYTVSSAERVLHGQQSDGRVSVTDSPACGGGRSYLIESDLELDDEGQLVALVADYIAQARELGEIPMASSAVRRLLDRAAIRA